MNFFDHFLKSTCKTFFFKRQQMLLILENKEATIISIFYYLKYIILSNICKHCLQFSLKRPKSSRIFVMWQLVAGESLIASQLCQREKNFFIYLFLTQFVYCKLGYLGQNFYMTHAEKAILSFRLDHFLHVADEYSRAAWKSKFETVGVILSFWQCVFQT